jgi:uncharacterized protein
MSANTLQQKENKLFALLQGLDKPAVALSGGVDSALLLAACSRAGVQAAAITAFTPLQPQFERQDASRAAQEAGCELYVLQPEPLALPEFCANDSRRCYYCKQLIFGAIKAKAQELGCGSLLDGANADDAGDYRPGMQAAAELGFISPLLACGFTKQEVRKLARRYGLAAAAKPAYACLASRIAYGETITPAKLAMVEQAEDALRKLGLKDLRVRCHGNLARIEINRLQIAQAADKMRQQIIDAVRGAGFDYVTLDLEGFASGSMNRLLEDKKEK